MVNPIASAINTVSNAPEAKFSFSAMKLDEFDIQIKTIYKLINSKKNIFQKSPYNQQVMKTIFNNVLLYLFHTLFFNKN